MSFETALRGGVLLGPAHTEQERFIRLHLLGASLGTRSELGHGLIIVLETAWVRQQRRNLSEFSNQ